MISLPETLPDSAPELVKLLLQLEQSAREELVSSERIIKMLKERVALLEIKRFGRSSEKYVPLQGSLFDEAELEALNPEPKSEPEPDVITVAPHQRQRGKRKPLPDNLPRVTTVIDLEASKKTCPEHGLPLRCIGREVSEQLDIIPAKVQVLRTERLKYACRCGECGVKTAPLPPQPLPKSMASAGLLSWLVVNKFLDGLPLYRQERTLNRLGVSVSRITLAHWLIKASALLQPLINLMYEHRLSYGYLGMDETRLQVLDEPGRAATSQSWMWVQRGGPPDKPVILFHYSSSRSAAVPLALLADYHGILQTDGYASYEAVVKKNGLCNPGCWDHARRRFHDAVKAQGKGKGGNAQMMLSLIQKLYRIERAGKELSETERFWLRRQQSIPVLKAIRQHLDINQPKAPPQSLPGKGYTYLNNQWESLILFVTDGRIPISNILTENAIRPFAIGRKNWLFAASVAGAESSAKLYSVMESARANGLEPYAYFRHLFTELPKAQIVEEIEALLPWNVKQELTSAPVLEA